MIKIFFIFFLLSVAQFVQAASCCGGSSAVPSLITTDDRAQISSSLTNSQIVVDSIDGAGVWRKNKDHQKTQTLKIDYAYVLDSNVQFGASVPFVQKQFQDQTYNGLSDVQLSVGYEYLPELEYNLYKPKGFVYAGVIVPTGYSKYASQNGGVDARGQGLWGVSFGHVLVKNYLAFDLIQILDLHHYVSQNLQTSAENDLAVRHGLGGQLTVGAGWNTSSSRLGTQVSWFYEDRIHVKSQLVNDSGYIEKYAQVTVSYSYMLTDLFGLSLSYSDQTALGSPINTSLGRSVSVQLSQRWTR